MLTGTHFLQGNAACAEGAIAAGCRFFAGYPITPSTEIAERMARRLPEVGGVFIQMEDEIGAIAAVIGASWAGVKAMTATSGPGFSLMQENIGLAAMTETPCVIVDVMRAGPSTGQPTKPSQQDVMQAKWGSHGDYEVIALSPASAQEMFDFTIECFNLAEEYRVPTILLADGFIAHAWERVVIPPPEEIKVVERKGPEAPPGDRLDLVPPMACFGRGYRVHVTGLTHDERGYPQADSVEVQRRLVKRLCDKIRANADRIVKTKAFALDDAEVVVIAYGAPSRPALKAVKMARENGLKAGLLRLITLWPFPEKDVIRLSSHVKAFIVLEMNYGQLVREVERAAKGTAVTLLSKLGEELHTPYEILRALKEVC